MEEPMKISELIKELTKLKNKHGNIKIGTWADGICKFIRSIKYIEATDANDNVVDSCVYLQWWDEGDDD
jgi:hypothetical protein